MDNKKGHEEKACYAHEELLPDGGTKKFAHKLFLLARLIYINCNVCVADRLQKYRVLSPYDMFESTSEVI
jgi:hypothetical protein